MLERVEVDGVVFYRSPLLAAAGVPQAFSTRKGGVSPAPFESRNLGNWSQSPIQDTDERIQENYRRLQAAAGLAGRRRRWSWLVHGNRVVVIDPDTETGADCKADALVTDDPADVVAVRVADCVPILLADAQRGRVGVIHAGWRGVASGIVDATVRAFAAPGEIIAAIGPCIGADEFVVGPEVVDAFRACLGSCAPVRLGDDDRARVDLREAVRLQLVASGVPARAIDTTDRCTVRDTDEFFSHRATGGVTGRMAALVGPRARASWS
jgi:YfiH family protein